MASGDPTPESVVLWTRVTVPPGDTVPVKWLVAKEPSLASPVASGTVQATRDRDHTVHVGVSGLRPASTYWYGF
ncbi:MAG TPA: PhoD-like phosphatase N-terminal domain-containing protein, partial [Acidimicrobiia bacterium]|nr:PhoD-like phosphatase N-terminal domain-containing protein [Acidimicrobiia bacterium]